ncbi:uncharacterized protein Tco025E_06587 [Trypanosoma conorhini]|uniref:Uncharacterized protein n=1 Tax=Trypanosoma conorhini TaxID=83891 RepID=A0A3R7RRY8_9TRYP|nr:uncharacterized protein Tco025E_06587 [Trypanosoma conorhini]RNF11653.1 hypothetical protein Tco025E_06587 [Trypanosoma conorhini]
MGRDVVKAKGKGKRGARGRPRSRSRSASKGRSRSASKGRSRSASKGGSRRKSRSGSRRKSRSRSRGRPVAITRQSADRSRGNSVAESRRNFDNASYLFPLRLLVEGEACLIDPHIFELEITLYRPTPEEGKTPLFFDTTACLFSDHGGQTDYVGIGRATTNNKGLSHIPHAVVTVDADSVGSRNFLEPAGGPSVIAGDGVSVNLKRLTMWAGFSLSTTLFTGDTNLSDVVDAYYAVKKPKAKIPLAVVPITVSNPSHNSCVTLMVRKMKGNAKTVWELVRIGETFSQQDVKGVLATLQKRGLLSPTGYRLLPYHGPDCSSEVGNEDSFSFDDEEEEEEEDDADAVCSSVGDEGEKFENLLANVPPVTREGRRQYSVGRSIVNTVLETADSSDEDEVLEDALRAVVPRYTSLCPVRYEDKTYNVGSRDEALAQHYVSHREKYGLETAESQSGKGFGLSPVFTPFVGTLQRLSFGKTGIARPSAPTELLTTIPSVLCRRSGNGRRGRSSISSRGLSLFRSRSKSLRGRKRKGKGKGRRSRSRKSRSRGSSSKRRKSRGGRARSGSSGRRKSRSGSAKLKLETADAQNGGGEEG